MTPKIGDHLWMLPWIKRRIGPFGKPGWVSRFEKKMLRCTRIHARYQAGHLTHQLKIYSMTLTRWPKTLVHKHHPTILSPTLGSRNPENLNQEIFSTTESRKHHLLALFFCFLGVFFGVLLPFLGVHVVGLNLFFEGEKTLAPPPPPSSNDKFLLTP